MKYYNKVDNVACIYTIYNQNISTSRAVPSSTQIKLEVKKLRSQQTEESFSAQLSHKLRQPQSSPDDIGGL